MLKKILFSFLLSFHVIFLLNAGDYSFGMRGILVHDYYKVAQIRDLIILRHRAIASGEEEKLIKCLDQSLQQQIIPFISHLERTGGSNIKLPELYEMMEYLGYVDLRGIEIPADPELSAQYASLKTSYEEAEDLILAVRLPILNSLERNIKNSMYDIPEKLQSEYKRYCNYVVEQYQHYISLRREEIRSLRRNRGCLNRHYDWGFDRKLNFVISNLDRRHTIGKFTFSGRSILIRIGYFEEILRLNSQRKYWKDYRRRGLYLESAIQYLIHERILTPAASEPIYSPDDIGEL